MAFFRKQSRQLRRVIRKPLRKAGRIYKKYRTPINLAATAGAVYASGGLAPVARRAAMRYAPLAYRGATYLNRRYIYPRVSRAVLGGIARSRRYRYASIMRGRYQYARAMYPRGLASSTSRAMRGLYLRQAKRYAMANPYTRQALKNSLMV